jgi:hypothetical protein
LEQDRNQMNYRLASAVIAALVVLKACGEASERQAALEDGIPLVNIIREPSGQETVLVGTIQPRMNFTSTFSTSSETGIECGGEFNNRGVGSVICTNGWRLNLEIPTDLYGTLNGSYVQTVDGIGSAVGWGSEADTELLRSLM